MTNSKNVAERRKKVAELYSTMTLEEIAEILDTSISTIQKDVTKLFREGVIHQRVTVLKKDKREEIERRRQKVAELYSTMTLKEIAERLGVSTNTIQKDITNLLDEGIIRQRVSGLKKEKREEIEKRRNNVAQLYGIMTLGEIAERLGVGNSTITKDIEFLFRKEILSERIKVPGKGKKKEIKKRRNKVAKLYGTMTLEEIAKKLGVESSTIKRDVEALISEGLITKRIKASSKETKEGIEARRKRVVELYGTMTLEEIARELGFERTTIKKDIELLIAEGKITKRVKASSKEAKEEIELRRQRVAELYGTMTLEEIAKKLVVGNSTVRRDVEALMFEGIIKVDKRFKANRKKEFIATMIFRIESYAKRGDFESAIKYFNILVSNVEVPENKKGMLEQIKQILKKGKDKQKINMDSKKIKDSNEEER